MLARVPAGAGAGASRCQCAMGKLIACLAGSGRCDLASACGTKCLALSDGATGRLGGANDLVTQVYFVAVLKPDGIGERL